MQHRCCTILARNYFEHSNLLFLCNENVRKGDMHAYRQALLSKISRNPPHWTLPSIPSIRKSSRNPAIRIMAAPVPSFHMGMASPLSKRRFRIEVPVKPPPETPLEEVSQLFCSTVISLRNSRNSVQTDVLSRTLDLLPRGLLPRYAQKTRYPTHMQKTDWGCV